MTAAPSPCISGCTVEGCERPRKYKLYCDLHQRRIRQTGEVGPVGHKVERLSGSLAERLWARISVSPDGCWEYTGARNSRRCGEYGRIRADVDGRRRVLNASVAAWEVTHGPVPHGLVVRHRCDNPPRCNPEHLELGTPADNSRDMAERGRLLTGERNPAAVLTADQVRMIRLRFAQREPRQRIAQDYDISTSLVHMIATGRVWGSV